jgi:hypothetical protein
MCYACPQIRLTKKLLARNARTHSIPFPERGAPYLENSPSRTDHRDRMDQRILNLVLCPSTSETAPVLGARYHSRILFFGICGQEDVVDFSRRRYYLMSGMFDSPPRQSTTMTNEESATSTQQY